MLKNMFLMGADTSLGSYFEKQAKYAGGYYNIQTSVTSIENVNVIVNCRGINHLSAIGKTQLADERILLNNVMPIYWLINELVARGIGPCRVLNVASQTYRIAQTNTALYCASKAALVQLTRTMARELAPAGWVINCLAPGKIEDTRMAELTDAQVLELRGWGKAEADAYALRNIPMRRFTNCAEVSEAMLKILELPSYINGTCIDMTGGA